MNLNLKILYESNWIHWQCFSLTYFHILPHEVPWIKVFLLWGFYKFIFIHILIIFTILIIILAFKIHTLLFFSLLINYIMTFCDYHIYICNVYVCVHTYIHIASCLSYVKINDSTLKHCHIKTKNKKRTHTHLSLCLHIYL